jgi:hypothetical protein
MRLLRPRALPRVPGTHPQVFMCASPFLHLGLCPCLYVPVSQARGRIFDVQWVLETQSAWVDTCVMQARGTARQPRRALLHRANPPPRHNAPQAPPPPPPPPPLRLRLRLLRPDPRRLRPPPTPPPLRLRLRLFRPDPRRLRPVLQRRRPLRRRRRMGLLCRAPRPTSPRLPRRRRAALLTGFYLPLLSDPPLLTQFFSA